MIKLPPDMNLDDYQQWFGGGFFYFTATGDMEDLKIGSLAAGPESHDGPVWIHDLHEREWALKGSLRRLLFPHWPLCGAINLFDPDRRFAVIARRVQKQQYRRTYNHRCVTIKIPRQWDLMRARQAKDIVHSYDRRLVQDVFEPTYPNVGELPKYWESGWFSVALSPYIIVIHDPEDSDLVYYRGDHVGYLQDSQIFTPVNRKMGRRVAKHLQGNILVAH